jgi:hypothetical protein
MTPIEILALSRMIKEAEEKLARGQVAPGTYKVNVSVGVSGPIVVEEDYEKRPTVSVPWTEAYALLREVALRGVDELIARVEAGQTIVKADLEVIKTAGFLSEDIMVETMKQAFAAKQAPKGKGSIMERVTEVEAAAERVKEIIAGRLGLTPSKGRVKADLTVEQIQPQTVAGSATQPQIAPTLAPSQDSVEAGLPEASQTL